MKRPANQMKALKARYSSVVQAIPTIFAVVFTLLFPRWVARLKEIKIFAKLNILILISLTKWQIMSEGNLSFLFFISSIFFKIRLFDFIASFGVSKITQETVGR